MLHESHSRIDALSSSTSQTTLLLFMKTYRAICAPVRGHLPKMQSNAFCPLLAPWRLHYRQLDPHRFRNPFQQFAYSLDRYTERCFIAAGATRPRFMFNRCCTNHPAHRRCQLLDWSNHSFLIYDNISCHLCPSQGSTCRKCSLTGFVLYLHPGGSIIGRWSLTGSETHSNSSHIVSTDTRNVV